ncbi:PRC-barrel domain-containing protein [Lichenibacterium ramalinae]|uniref:PRC-barrel domain containing protein n=1 Tax=Lichenibacterium ramalinae TaxID=2316527 RepID=A0A4Q2RCQ0_9HYPH|nr:PRC-barrel domain-containing protein [Lichenibacterium ramalinae]RYB05291.1 PRC-barrel domain containing protein [Lichenibacterium ramalinae]
MKTLIAAAALSSLVAGSAFAAEPATGTMANGAMANGGITMADHATATIHYVTVSPADIMSSKLVGQDVYNNQGDKIGNVADLVIDNGKTITGIVLSVGGFLGMGEHYVLIEPSSMVLSDKNGLHGVVDTSKDSLKNAPAFNYKKS